MGKSSSKTKGEILETKLLKTLDDLEATLAKGDPVTENPTEGGLVADGAKLSAQAPRGKNSEGDAHKAMSASDRSSDSDSDSSSSKKKSMAKAAASSDSASDDGSSDESSDSYSGKKSLLDRAVGDPKLSKGIEVSGFLKDLVEMQSQVIEEMRASFEKSINDLSEKVDALGQAMVERDEQVGKSLSAAATTIDSSGMTDFQRKMAKAIVYLGRDLKQHTDDLGDLRGLLKSVLRLPAPQPRRSVLTKAEVVQRDFGGDEDINPLLRVDRRQICNWLVEKAMAGKIDERIPIAFEADHYDPTTLPDFVQKAITDDLVK